MIRITANFKYRQNRTKCTAALWAQQFPIHYQRQSGPGTRHTWRLREEEAELLHCPNLGIRKGVSGQHHAPAALYPVRRRQSGPHSRQMSLLHDTLLLTNVTKRNICTRINQTTAL
jgi:hypothetical protein